MTNERIKVFPGSPPSFKEIYDELEAIQKNPPPDWILGHDGIWRSPHVFVDYITIIRPPVPAIEAMKGVHQRVKSFLKELHERKHEEPPTGS